MEDDITNFRLYLSAYLKQSYNSSKSANLAIYATIKEYIKFVKEKASVKNDRPTDIHDYL
ncbi:MAG: hypothetical protein IPL98_10200 [Saprospiraceae bacterium]|nr:hypothetical protein [Saprospiraceae bacterium]